MNPNQTNEKIVNAKYKSLLQNLRLFLQSILNMTRKDNYKRILYAIPFKISVRYVNLANV